MWEPLRISGCHLPSAGVRLVFRRNQLAKGNAEFCAILVAVNSVMQIILYAPLALFYLKVHLSAVPLVFSALNPAACFVAHLRAGIVLVAYLRLLCSLCRTA